MLRDLLLAWLVVAIAALAVECYVLIGRVDRLTQWVRQLLEVASDLLAAQPGKSAPRTEAPPGLKPRVWWPRRLRLSAWTVEVVDEPPATEPAPEVVEGEVLAATPGRRRPSPVPRTDTRPADVVLADQADEWRQRFQFAEHGRRPDATRSKP